MSKDLRTELKKIATEILLLKDDTKLELVLEKVRDLYEKTIVLNSLNNNKEVIPGEEKNTLEMNESDNHDVAEININSPVNEDIEEKPFVKKEIEKESSTVVEKENLEAKHDAQISDKLQHPNEKEIEKEPVSLNDLFVPTFDSIKEDMSQKTEFKDTISLEETGKLFETKKGEAQQLSLNDKLVNSSIQIGLNDRIAFVNKLFNFSQTEFNTVLSNLNACKNKQEALNYIQYKVKPKFDWKDKEELEERLILIIERKFIN